MKTLFLTIVLAFVSIAAFSQTSSGYEGQQLQQQVRVERGIVLQVRQIDVGGSQTGTTIGGILGGLLGVVASQNTDNYAAKGVAATLGATLGGVIGKKTSGNAGLELIIQKSDGTVVSVTQSADSTSFAVGQRVLFISGRVLPDMTATFATK